MFSKLTKLNTNDLQSIIPPKVEYYKLDEETENWRRSEDLIPLHIQGNAELSPEKSKSVMNLSNCLKVNVEMESSPTIISSDVQRKGMMVSIEETEIGQEEEEIHKIDIICIIDLSGSMRGKKLENIKQTLNYLLSILEGSRIAIVTFETNAEVLMNFKTVNETNKEKIMNTIKSMRQMRSTNIKKGLQLSLELYSQRKTSNKICSMFLLTDGFHNQGKFSYQDILGGHYGLSKSDYSLHCFGFGADHDAELMQEMSLYKGGRYYFVEDISRVDECFVDCLGTVTTCIANKTQIRLKLTPTPHYPEIRILKGYGSAIKIISDSEVEIYLHTIYAGMRKNFIFDVEFDGAGQKVDSAKSIIIGKIDIRSNEISNCQTTNLTKDIQINISHCEPDPKNKNLEVLKNLKRVRGVEAMDNAEKWRMKGKFQEAVDVLRLFLKEIEGEEEILRVDNMILSLCEQMDILIMMIENEIKGISNGFKTSYLLMQNKNQFENEQSVPTVGSRSIFQTRKQCRDRLSLLGSKKFLI